MSQADGLYGWCGRCFAPNVSSCGGVSTNRKGRVLYYITYSFVLALPQRLPYPKQFLSEVLILITHLLRYNTTKHTPLDIRLNRHKSLGSVRTLAKCMRTFFVRHSAEGRCDRTEFARARFFWITKSLCFSLSSDMILFSFPITTLNTQEVLGKGTHLLHILRIMHICMF